MPLVSRTFDQLIDFTRTSAATYVDATGKIVPTAASRNLLTYTQEFDNAGWGKTGATVTANATTAPDGTLTADTVTAISGASIHRVVSSAATIAVGTSCVHSVYVKAGTHNLVQIHDGASAIYFANFNLSTGAVGTSANCTASITAVGDGWYRCAIIFTVAVANPVFCLALISSASAVRNESWTAAGTETIYLWGAQLEAVPDANLVLGSELVTNGDFASGSTGWTVPAGWSIGSGVATATATNASLISTSAVTAGKVYRVAFDVSSYTSGTLYVRVGAGSAVTVTGAGSKVVYLTATNTSGVEFYGGVISLSIDNISVKEITGTTGMPTDYTRNNGGVYTPRFDYDPVTLAPKGLLVEEQRTNLLTYSEQFDNAAWGKGGATVTANAVTSPDGTVDADKLVEDTANSGHGLTLSYAVVSATTYALSFYAKAAGRSRISFSGGGFAAQGFNAIFDVSNGTMVLNNGDKATITAVGNGWYRCTVAFTTSSTVSFGLAMADNSNNTTYTGDGTSGIYIWGAQLEAGAFATSYIPTVASQVTRSADIATITGANFSQFYNQSEGTIVWEGDFSAFSSNRLVAIDGGVSVRTADISAVSNAIVYYKTSDAQQISMGAATAGSLTKVALAIKANDFNGAINGTLGGADTATGGVATADRLSIGHWNNSSFLNGHIRSIKYFPTRLSNSQLQALTA